jgi:nucleoside-diphosphate-sugar epimerase
MVSSTGTLLVAGGAGYVGSALVPRLLEKGYKVRVLDLYLYDDEPFLSVKGHPNLSQIKGDVRDLALVRESLRGCEAVIHLACISNDPSFELNPVLARSINFDAFGPFVKIAKEEGVQRFIFASSSSVYGISDAASVTEDHPHLPITDYNKYKSLCESILWEAKGPGFVPVSIRPATLCGYAPRLRLDLTVNILTNQAVNLGKITVFGGSQMRPNLHIRDMVDLYLMLLEVDVRKISGQAFNVAYQNYKVSELAEIVKKVVSEKIPARKNIGIETTVSDDIRSYHISSEKIKKELGFIPRHSVEEAISGLIDAFGAGKIPNPMTDIKYYNVRKLKALGLK